ncbi:YceI family protein [Herbiconiux sp. CPCC 205763]|uniref:YceI family protein n=1 Tax=Herbiconiux aconitum TaxID=2970913 RepID=A0ABT2GSQ2_9MICO|nr:YceI family protein [Herbiconiux aconitum]MCS5719240.1 YceI family protein [Herbiconiux aconitum]
MNSTAKYALALVAGVAAVGVVAVVALPIVSRGVSLDPGASVQQVVPTVFDSPEQNTTGTGDESRSWHLDPASTVGYRISSSGDHVVSGETSELSGVIEMSGDRLTDAEFMVDLSTLASDDGGMDALLQSLILAGGGSTASFVLTEPVDLGDAIDASADAVPAPRTVSIVGALTVRGITNPVEAEVSLAFDGDSGMMTGSIPVDLASYGIDVPDFGVLDLDDTAYIDVDLVASPAR